MDLMEQQVVEAIRGLNCLIGICPKLDAAWYRYQRDTQVLQEGEYYLIKYPVKFKLTKHGSGYIGHGGSLKNVKSEVDSIVHGIQLGREIEANDTLRRE